MKIRKALLVEKMNLLLLVSMKKCLKNVTTEKKLDVLVERNSLLSKCIQEGLVMESPLLCQLFLEIVKPQIIKKIAHTIFQIE